MKTFIKIGSRAWSLGGTPSPTLWDAGWTVRLASPHWLRKRGIILLRYDNGIISRRGKMAEYKPSTLIPCRLDKIVITFMEDFMLEIGKKYARFNDHGHRISFSFNEPVGEYLGIVPSGFLRFKLSIGRECIVNGGNYELVCE